MIRPQDWLSEEEVKRIPRNEWMGQISLETVLLHCKEAAVEI
jgi:hypothetical protein